MVTLVCAKAAPETNPATASAMIFFYMANFSQTRLLPGEIRREGFFCTKRVPLARLRMVPLCGFLNLRGLLGTLLLGSGFRRNDGIFSSVRYLSSWIDGIRKFDERTGFLLSRE
jgi:hypothetical protein